MAILRLFATVRVAAGIGRDTVEGSTVGEVIDAARDRYGEEFAALVPICRVWVNGEAADESTAVADTDEVALLPPVSGGQGLRSPVPLPTGTPPDNAEQPLSPPARE